MPNCISCKNKFEIAKDEQDFLKKMVFRYGDDSFELPAPEICPDCRSQLRTAHRNEQFLYHSKSAMSGKQLISLYSPKPAWGSPYKVFTQEEWNSDGWDPLQYGRDFDFNIPFFEQFFELVKEVPRLPLMQVSNENSPFTTGTGYCKNCHLINSSEYCEDCYYGKLLQNSKSSIDCSYLYDSEYCYECFSVYKSYNCIYLSYSSNCSDCWFSENLTGCKNCILCTNLSHKEYCFMNKPLEKEEYEKRLAQMKGSYSNFETAKKLLVQLREERTHKYANVVNSENCTGDFIENSKSCIDCYDVNESQDCKYVMVGVQVKDTYDCSNMYVKPELNYQVLGTIETYHVAYSLYAFHSQNVLYSEQVFNSKDLFGCAGLSRKQYCIFNKQYTREEYEELVPKIIEHMKKTGEWGQFFPIKYSPHAYNETLANEYYPMSKEDVLSRGWRWHEDDGESAYEGPEIEIADHIKDVPKTITQNILKCKISGKFYKIIPHEYNFYKTIGVPVPRNCPDQRHVERMKIRNPRKLWNRECGECGAALRSSYDSNRPEAICCEKCYLESIY